MKLALGLDPVEKLESALLVIAVRRKCFPDCVGVKLFWVSLRFWVPGDVIRSGFPGKRLMMSRER